MRPSRRDHLWCTAPHESRSHVPSDARSKPSACGEPRGEAAAKRPLVPRVGGGRPRCPASRARPAPVAERIPPGPNGASRPEGEGSGPRSDRSPAPVRDTGRSRVSRVRPAPMPRPARRARPPELGAGGRRSTRWLARPAPACGAGVASVARCGRRPRRRRTRRRRGGGLCSRRRACRAWPDEPEVPVAVPRQEDRRQRPVPAGLATTEPAGQLVPPVVRGQLTGVDHARRGHPGRPLGDAQVGAPTHEQPASRRMHAEEQAGDDGPGAQRTERDSLRTRWIAYGGGDICSEMRHLIGCRVRHDASDDLRSHRLPTRPFSRSGRPRPSSGASCAASSPPATPSTSSASTSRPWASSWQRSGSVDGGLCPQFVSPKPSHGYVADARSRRMAVFRNKAANEGRAVAARPGLRADRSVPAGARGPPPGGVRARGARHPAGRGYPIPLVSSAGVAATGQTGWKLLKSLLGTRVGPRYATRPPARSSP